MLTTWLNTSPGMGARLSAPTNRRLVRSAAADFELPPVELFDRIVCFDRLEVVLRQSGMNATRLRPGNGAGIVLGWDVVFQRRDKLQHIRFVIEQFDRPARISGTAHVQSLEIAVVLDIMARNRFWSRVAIDVVPRPPRDLRSRLTLYSLGLQMDRLVQLLREVVEAPLEAQAVLRAIHSEPF